MPKSTNPRKYLEEGYLETEKKVLIPNKSSTDWTVMILEETSFK
jgi:hypothetical protein